MKNNSHSRADNIIREVAETHPGKKIYAMIGGFHLFRLADEEVRAFAANMRMVHGPRRRPASVSARCGAGTAFMLELERLVKENGGAMIQLQAVNDAMHEAFYGKLNYKNAENFVLKSKWL